MCKYLTNAYSPKMLKTTDSHKLIIKTINEKELMKNKDDCITVIGHHNLAEKLGVPRNRYNIQLEKGDELYIIRSKKIRDEEIYSYHKLIVQ